MTRVDPIPHLLLLGTPSDSSWSRSESLKPGILAVRAWFSGAFRFPGETATCIALEGSRYDSAISALPRSWPLPTYAEVYELAKASLWALPKAAADLQDL